MRDTGFGRRVHRAIAHYAPNERELVFTEPGCRGSWLLAGVVLAFKVAEALRRGWIRRRPDPEGGLDALGGVVDAVESGVTRGECSHPRVSRKPRFATICCGGVTVDGSASWGLVEKSTSETTFLDQAPSNRTRRRHRGAGSCDLHTTTRFYATPSAETEHASVRVLAGPG